ncbi:MAG: protein-glutamate O-methyltransferase CheR [Desulfobacterales bacterium]|nr:protein-glutamate O-methyltransferase CheR [Desulfobacterales bacterium]
MTIQATNQEFQLFREFIEEKSGIFLGDNKKYLIENRLSPIVQKNSCRSYLELYLKLKKVNDSNPLMIDVVEAMTTNETLWFRDQYPFRILSETILPAYMREIQSGKRKKVSIWSSGCSTGQEPYSIAMTVMDYYQRKGLANQCKEQLSILATDLSESIIGQAKQGQYNHFTMQRGMPSTFYQKYFTQRQNMWVLNQEIKELVTFKMFNLQASLEGLGVFDVIFLRNVIIYFSDSFKRDLFNRLSKILTNEGYLFLGTGETVTGYTEKYNIIDNRTAVYYQLKQQGCDHGKFFLPRDVPQK